MSKVCIRNAVFITKGKHMMSNITVRIASGEVFAHTDIQHLTEVLHRAVQEGAEEITVTIPAGQHFLGAPLVLTSETVGQGCALRFVCEDAEPAMLCGWMPVTGFKETTVGGVYAWAAPMPEKDGKTLYSYSFFDKAGSRLERPRFPEKGFLYPVNIPGFEGYHNPFGERSIWGRDSDIMQNRTDAFYFAPGELPSMTRLGDIQGNMLHFWVGEKMTVKSVDMEKNLISFASPTVYLMGSEISNKGRYKGGRYFLDNVFEMLKKPGQVYDDRESGTLYYIPREGETPDDCIIYAADSEQLLIIDGMKQIAFENIVFAGSDWKRTDRQVTVGAQQAAADVEIPCVSVNNTTGLRFSGCSFLHIGNYAVKLVHNVHDASFTGCEFRDIGAGAFWCAGSREGSFENGPAPEVCHNIRIEDCVISDYGIIFPDAVGIFFQYAYDVVISHNEITHGRYSGISLGWTWSKDYEFQPSGYLVEKNIIYDIGMEIMSDLGGIYTNGKLPNTTLRGNVIHDIRMIPGGYGGWGIYTDAFSAGITIEDNLIYDCSATPFNSSQADGNLVRNNIFAFGDEGSVNATTYDGNITFHLEHNILVTKNAPPYVFYLTEKNTAYFTDDSNLIWDYAMGATYSGWENLVQSRPFGIYHNIRIADPMFADPEKRDFTLSPDSPALKIGFVPFAYQDAGPRK